MLLFQREAENDLRILCMTRWRTDKIGKGHHRKKDEYVKAISYFLAKLCNFIVFKVRTGHLVQFYR